MLGEGLVELKTTGENQPTTLRNQVLHQPGIAKYGHVQLQKANQISIKLRIIINLIKRCGPPRRGPGSAVYFMRRTWGKYMEISFSTTDTEKQGENM